MNREVQIVERGRGPQLSTSRITVQDLVPYLQKKWTYEQIMVAMPILTVADIQAVEGYVRENYDAVMEVDRRIRERKSKSEDSARDRGDPSPRTREAVGPQGAVCQAEEAGGQR